MIAGAPKAEPHIYLDISRYIYIYAHPPPGLSFHLCSLEKLIISKVGGEHIYIYISMYIFRFDVVHSFLYILLCC